MASDEAGAGAQRRPGVDGPPRHDALIRRALVAIFLPAAAILVIVTAWVVVPAPDLVTLVVAVVAPEWSPYLALAALGIAIFAVVNRRDRLGLIVASLAGLALVFALPAVVSYPSAVVKADDALRKLPGDRGWPVSPYDPFARTGTTGVTIDDDIPVPLRDGTTTLGLDLYRPWTPGPHPAVVVVYGGAWRFGDRLQCRPLAIDLARAGYVVVMADYRHVPDFQSPTQVEDVQDALALLQREHLDWDVDPDRIALLGRSAGAQIALVLASTPEPVHVAAAVGIYAPIDLVGGYERPPRPDPANVRQILADYLGGPPNGEYLGEYLSAAPQTHVAAMTAPTLLITGTSDELVLPRFQRRYARALRARGTTTIALELPLANHAFDGAPLGRGVTFERAVLLRFLDSVLRRGPLRRR